MGFGAAWRPPVRSALAFAANPLDRMRLYCVGVMSSYATILPTDFSLILLVADIHLGLCAFRLVAEPLGAADALCQPRLAFRGPATRFPAALFRSPLPRSFGLACLPKRGPLFLFASMAPMVLTPNAVRSAIVKRIRHASLSALQRLGLATMHVASSFALAAA